MQLDAKKIMENRIADRLGITQYGQIMQSVRDTDVSTDADFQRLFNGYYLIRRNAGWRKVYYTLFEAMKTTTPTFRKIITHLYEKTDNIEASFSSKLLATLRSDHPIWDQYVIKILGYRLAGKNKQEMLENAIRIYAGIEEWYDRFLGTEDANACIDVFNSTLPKFTWISDVKKVDFFLWSSR